MNLNPIYFFLITLNLKNEWEIREIFGWTQIIISN